MSNTIKIAGRLKNAEYGGYVAGAVDIYDDDLNASQSQLNDEQQTTNEGLRVDIDENTENIGLLRDEVQQEQMVIGATVFDPWPVEGSIHPVTSGGIYTKNIQAEVVVGDPTGDWNPTTAEAAYEYVQEEILTLNAQLNAAQLEIGAVGTDLEPTSGSANYLTSGALYNLLQTLAIPGDLVSTVG